jgi:hypothetical protein
MADDRRAEALVASIRREVQNRTVGVIYSHPRHDVRVWGCVSRFRNTHTGVIFLLAEEMPGDMTCCKCFATTLPADAEVNPQRTEDCLVLLKRCVHVTDAALRDVLVNHARLVLEEVQEMRLTELRRLETGAKVAEGMLPGWGKEREGEP